jgi:Septum formation
MNGSGLTRILAVAVAATALTLGITPADALATDGPMYGAPTVGTCSVMTAQQTGLQTDKSTVVPCTHKHTAKVAGVVQLPAKVGYGDSFQTLYRVVADRCLPKVDVLLGRTNGVRDSSAYIPIWFVPTRKQRRHGARWVSCSIVLAHATKLAPLPTDKSPLLPSGNLGNQVARCLKTLGGTLYTTGCRATHQWRATGTLAVSGAYPGRKALNKIARRKCVSRVHSRTYRWLYLDKITWNVGHDHAVVCFTKTTH